MSGFGLRTLKKKTEDHHNATKRSYFKHIVYGENLAAILTFQKLHTAYPGEVKLITRNPYYLEEINHDLHCSMQDIRSEDVANNLIGLYPQMEIFKNNDDVFFYKDTKFHKFGGRAKSHELHTEEKFYQGPFYQAKPENLITVTDETLKESQLNKFIQDITLTTPSDLVEKVNFRLESGEEEYFDCEFLYFCESPKKFFQLVEDKASIADPVAQYIAPLSNHRAITVYFECTGEEIYNPGSSLIIPQSMTHDWGSFVLDFGQYDPETKTQTIKALSFIAEDDVQEEDLAKKIRHMYTVIKRVLPEFGKAQVKQTIKYSDEFFTEGINDELASQLGEFPIKFISPSAPIVTSEPQSYQYLSRTLMALDQVQI